MANDVLRPEHKHGQAIAQRQEEFDVTKIPLYTAILNTIEESRALSSTAPVTLYGVPTQEFCIVPCMYNDQESTVMRVLQALRGAGCFADLFRISESVDNPDKYRFAVLVSWDPRVISASFAPRFYSVKDTSRIPCAVCPRQKTGDVAECKGCAVFKLWLAGAAGLKTWNDPCTVCYIKKAKTANPQAAAACDKCPTKTLWLRRKNGEFAQPLQTEAAKSTQEQGDTETA